MSDAITSDDLHDLIESVRELSGQVKLLWQALDEVRTELDWANNNAQDLMVSGQSALIHHRITSCRADPTAADFHVNAVPEETVAQLRKETGRGHQHHQPELFE